MKQNEVQKINYPNWPFTGTIQEVEVHLIKVEVITIRIHWDHEDRDVLTEWNWRMLIMELKGWWKI